MKRLAVIDCGTNTFNLLIVETENNRYKKVFKTRIPVKLGEDTINLGYINSFAFERGILAINNFKTICNNYNVNEIYAFATSAIRDASNGITFTKDVKNKFNIDIRIIDGNEEAELIYHGNKQAVPLNDKISLIMDIGGGSNEFILCNKDTIFWKQSFKLGAARLIEKFKPEDKISLKTIDALNNYLNVELKDLHNACDKYCPIELVGSSGAFDSIIEMIHGEFNGEMLEDFKHCYEVDLNKFNLISEKIINSNYKQRTEIKGLVEMRIDMIVISCILIKNILDKLNLQNMRVSTYSLKEGALYKILNKIK
ncbi:MAG: phosphatase [Bacteroidetes bacterium]|nr:phosphatase [Bacteroidota bacterium]